MKQETTSQKITRLQAALLERQKCVGFVGEAQVIDLVILLCQQSQDHEARLQNLEVIVGAIVLGEKPEA